MFLYLNPQTTMNYCLWISFTKVLITVLKSLHAHNFLLKEGIKICPNQLLSYIVSEISE